MREYRLAVAASCATFLLLVIGGLVHATGSSLACPDWPLCYGQVFPKMEGGILYEHGHRLVALAVALATVLLAVLVFRARRAARLRRLAVLAVALVAVQAVLGGVTVILKLPLLVSSAHLATSMAFFLSLIYLAHGLRPAGEAALGGAPAGRALVGAALAFTFVQIVLGALVRHTGTGLACGTGIPLCDGSLWPSGGPAQLQMAHRWAGAALAALIALAAAGPLRDGLHRARRAQAWLSAGAVLLIAVQVGLGLLTVATGISIPVVTAHLGAGALLLADLFLLFLLLAPGRSRVGDTAAGRLAHAHG